MRYDEHKCKVILCNRLAYGKSYKGYCENHYKSYLYWNRKKKLSTPH